MSETKQKQAKEANIKVVISEAQHHQILAAWLKATRLQGDFEVLVTTQGRDSSLSIGVLAK